ncbi:MAG: hypothetical protein ABIS68_12250, partial [Casimicrobiaceae bacterium]
LLACATGVRAQTIDDALAGCPTAAEVAAINAKLSLDFEFDSTAPTLVCTTGAGSANLTEMMRRVYKLLLAIPQVTTFDAPLPWTSASYVDWLYNESGLKGIRFRQGIGNSFCCSPAGVINLVVGLAPPYLDSFKDLLPVWNDPVQGGYGSGLLSIITHETRHIKYGPHTCGSDDNTIEEYGAWGTQFSIALWLANHSNPNFFRPKTPPAFTSGAAYYRDYERSFAEQLRESTLCHDTRVIQTKPVTEFYNTGLGHYFMTAEQAEVQAIQAGAAGPGWILTGQSFKAYTGPANARSDAVPVCRFYGTPGKGPNSHFYTAEPAECAAVKQDPGWTYEGIAFYAVGSGAGCPYSRYDSKSLPSVYRVYNNRFATNDSNHRFTTEQALYNQMRQQTPAWSGEGTVFCAAP